MQAQSPYTDRPPNHSTICGHVRVAAPAPVTRVKLANNLFSRGTRLMTLEAMALAVKNGVEGEKPWPS